MFCLISFLIVCFGGINWLCIGLFQFDLIAGIFGSQATFVSRFFYMIIGLASVCSLIALPIQKGRVYIPQNSPPKNTPKNKKKSPKRTNTQRKNESPNLETSPPNTQEKQIKKAE